MMARSESGVAPAMIMGSALELSGLDSGWTWAVLSAAGRLLESPWVEKELSSVLPESPLALTVLEVAVADGGVLLGWGL